MKRGGKKFLVSTTMLAVAACGSQQGKLEIRSSPARLAKGEQPVSQRIAEARGQLALGNVALALEAFRIASREDPRSLDALAGIATCYDRMGRYDLSRRHYEAALALAPADVDLLGAFAASLQAQGRVAEASSVRREIALRAAAAAPEAEQVAVAIPMSPAPSAARADKVTVVNAAADVPATLAAAQAEAVQASPPVRVREPKSIKLQPFALAVPHAAPIAAENPQSVQNQASKADVQIARVEHPQPAPAAPPARQAVAKAAVLGPSVTIKLPAARPVENPPAPVLAATAPKQPAMVELDTIVPTSPPEAPVPIDMPVELASIAPVQPHATPVPKPAVVEDSGPRLERLSMGEIALITSSGPIWGSTTVARTERSTTVRFVPLRQASMQAKVRLLNAARVNRLAARTRTWLKERGWRAVSIGNARSTRTRSIILYPADQKALARRLSAQFGFPLARRASGAHVTVLLGADAARRRALQPAGA